MAGLNNSTICLFSHQLLDNKLISNKFHKVHVVCLEIDRSEKLQEIITEVIIIFCQQNLINFCYFLELKITSNFQDSEIFQLKCGYIADFLNSVNKYQTKLLEQFSPGAAKINKNQKKLAPKISKCTKPNVILYVDNDAVEVNSRDSIISQFLELIINVYFQVRIKVLLVYFGNLTPRIQFEKLFP